MGSPYNREVGQQNKAGGSGKAVKTAGTAAPQLRMSGPNWPKVPGKTGPNRSAGYAKAPVYPRSQGL